MSYGDNLSDKFSDLTLLATKLAWFQSLVLNAVVTLGTDVLVCGDPD